MSRRYNATDWVSIGVTYVATGGPARAPPSSGPLLAIGAVDGTKRASLLVPNPFFVSPDWWDNVAARWRATSSRRPWKDRSPRALFRGACGPGAAARFALLALPEDRAVVVSFLRQETSASRGARESPRGTRGAAATRPRACRCFERTGVRARESPRGSRDAAATRPRACRCFERTGVRARESPRDSRGLRDPAQACCKKVAAAVSPRPGPKHAAKESAETRSTPAGPTRTDD